MFALRQLCHLAYGPVTNRVLDPQKTCPTEVEERGLIKVIQLSGSDFDAAGYPSKRVAGPKAEEAGQLVFVPPELIASFGVSRNSLLYLAKGSQHRACLPEFESRHPLLTGSSFIRLEVEDPEVVLRDYIFLQLRSTATWRQLERRQEGAFIKNINRGALANVQVEVPPLARQHTIVEYARLQRRAATLRTQLNTLDQRRLNGLLNHEN